MSKNKSRIIGGKRLQAKLSSLSAAVDLNNAKVMADLLTEVDSDAKKSIATGSRSGRIYTRGSVRHQASAPGEFPKTDTGNLIAGFIFYTQKISHKVVGTLENRSPHANALEFRPRSKGGRPFMRPIYKKWLPIAQRRLL